MQFRALYAVFFFVLLSIAGLTPREGEGADEAVLRIEANPVLQSILAEARDLGSSPEAYVLAEKYRLDLTLIDLVDQVTLLTDGEDEASERLKKAYLSAPSNPFMTWLSELHRILASDPDLKKKLDQKLRLQFYTSSSVALEPEYRMIDFDKIKDNGLLARIHRYNDIAQDPEGQGLLLAFQKRLHSPFFTEPLTVEKFQELSRRDLRMLRKAYYQALARLYQKHDPEMRFIYRVGSGKFLASKKLSLSAKSFQVFNILAALPNKQEILLFLSAEVPGIPRDGGLIILTPTFIDEHRIEIDRALRKYAENQIIESLDDRYLLGLRKWIKSNRGAIERRIEDYNAENGTQFVLFYKNTNRLPRRAEALFNHEILLKVYPELPWLSRDRGLVFDKKGRERHIDLDPDHPHARLFERLFHELSQTETYLSVLVGGAALILLQGNVPIAMSVKKVTKDGVRAIRYGYEWRDFLREIPSDVLSAFLLGTGISAGRLYKVLALGAGRGALQSLFTKEDVKTGAAVGMLYQFLATYLVPARISRPMANGFDEKALALNRKLELLEGVIRGGLQGTTVSLIDGDAVLGGLWKGSAYGVVSTQLMIWCLGTRYSPFKDFDPAEVDETINLENEFQNEFGRGGVYEINRRLIQDANFRVGGFLPNFILKASITLPGNVAMGDNGFQRLTTLTHEASHLMQQEQSGVFGFYLFRYIPAAFRMGYSGHPDENFLSSVVGGY